MSWSAGQQRHVQFISLAWSLSEVCLTNTFFAHFLHCYFKQKYDIFHVHLMFSMIIAFSINSIVLSSLLLGVSVRAFPEDYLRGRFISHVQCTTRYTVVQMKWRKKWEKAQYRCSFSASCLPKVFCGLLATMDRTFWRCWQNISSLTLLSQAFVHRDAKWISTHAQSIPNAVKDLLTQYVYNMCALKISFSVWHIEVGYHNATLSPSILERLTLQCSYFYFEKSICKNISLLFLKRNNVLYL